MSSLTARKKERPAIESWQRTRRAWLLERLAEADGPSYDALCHETATRFPIHGQDGCRLTGAQAVRAVRGLLWDELAVTEPDETIWLTAAGWAALEALRPVRRAA